MDLNMGLIKADILMAKQGIEIFEENKIREVKNMSAYHLQQAVEKLITQTSHIPSSLTPLYYRGSSHYKKRLCGYIFAF